MRSTTVPTPSSDAGTLIRYLPADALVPVWWVRQHLLGELARGGAEQPVNNGGADGRGCPDAQEVVRAERCPTVAAPLDSAADGQKSLLDERPTAWLTAVDFGARRSPPRGVDWVRDHCREGRIPGAVRDGAAWLIPLSALEEPLVGRAGDRAPARLEGAAAGSERTRRAVPRGGQRRRGPDGSARTTDRSTARPKRSPDVFARW